MFDTVFYTVLSGTLVLVIGQIIKSFFIDPIIELHKLIGEVDYSLHFYADLYANPGVAKPELMDEAKNTIRKQASQLRAKAYAIRLYWLRRNAIAASDILTRLSNSIHEGNAHLNIEDRNKIRNYCVSRIKFSIRLGFMFVQFSLHTIQQNAAYR